MKESKKLAVKEWAQEHGMNVTDYVEAAKLKSDHASYVGSYWFMLVLLVVVCLLMLHTQSQFSNAVTNCLEFFGQAPHNEVKEFCAELIKG